jgi:SAM-dependent methyltransferase
MSADETPRYSPDWLALREPADAEARATELLEPLRDRLAGVARPVLHDLGCGTGSLGRWLAVRLPGPQHWVMYDRDPELLEHARANMVASAADGAPVTVETRRRDVTRLTPADLAGAALVTASALLDLLTLDEVDTLAVACVGAACPALLTLSVVGRVELTPGDPLDAEIAAAFDAHQRRDTGGRRLLGPDAVEATAEAFTRLGAPVLRRPSPWRLGADRGALAAQWLRGWVAAAVEQRPELAQRAEDYLRRRLAAAEAGELRVAVHHSDLLAAYE